jgi:hypothetical protein
MTESHKVLRRSRNNRIIAGVCGGLGEFFGISAFWFRLGFLIALTRIKRNDQRTNPGNSCFLCKKFAG